MLRLHWLFLPLHRWIAPAVIFVVSLVPVVVLVLKLVIAVSIAVDAPVSPVICIRCWKKLLESLIMQSNMNYEPSVGACCETWMHTVPIEFNDMGTFST